jgi:hypothetical protein
VPELNYAGCLEEPMPQSSARPISAISDMATMSGIKPISGEDVVVSRGPIGTILVLNGIILFGFIALSGVILSGYKNLLNQAATSRIASALQLSAPPRQIFEKAAEPNAQKTSQQVPSSRIAVKTRPVTPSMIERVRILDAAAVAAAQQNSAVPKPSPSVARNEPTPKISSITAAMATPIAVKIATPSSATTELAVVTRKPAAIPAQSNKSLPAVAADPSEPVTINFVYYQKAKVQQCGVECRVPFETSTGQKFIGSISDLKYRDALLVARGSVNLEGTVITGPKGMVLQITGVKVNSPFAELDRVFSVKKKK